jgi:hypothetical protein
MSLVGIGTLAPPLSPASVPLPPEPKGGKANSRAGEGLGESQFQRLPTLWVPPSRILSLSAPRRRCRTSQLQDYRIQEYRLPSPPSFKCNVLRESLFVDSQNIPCATLNRKGSWVISVYLCLNTRIHVKSKAVKLFRGFFLLAFSLRIFALSFRRFLHRNCEKLCRQLCTCSCK